MKSGDLADLPQTKEFKRDAVIWEKVTFNHGWTISKISVIEAYLMIVIICFILNAWDFAFMEFFKTNWFSLWRFGSINAYRKSPCRMLDYLYYNSGSNNNLSTDYKTVVDMTDTTLAKSFTKSPYTFGCSEIFSELAMITIQRQSSSMPKTVSGAEILYNEISSIWS